jgi:hypothetical protein
MRNQNPIPSILTASFIALLSWSVHAQNSSGGSASQSVPTNENLTPGQVHVKGSDSSGTTGSYGRKSGSSLQGTSGDHSTTLGNGSAMSSGSEASGGDASVLNHSSSDQNSNQKMKHRNRNQKSHSKSGSSTSDSSSHQ